ncbi:MAG: hypothetical protein EHM65_10435 [Acidobacteriales bacterium]|nr:MAG: hypothetical protein EHM65_10435 [Terriglobales bacterium]
MATKKNQTAVAEQKPQALVPVDDVIDFSADLGAGFEETSKDSFAIPFLRVLQKGSPQVDEEDAMYIPGAKPGMFLNSVSGEVYDGKAKIDEAGNVAGGGVLLIVAAYQERFVHWGPRGGDGGGFKGEMNKGQVEQLRAEGAVVEYEGKLLFPLADGELNPKKCERLQDTRNWFCILIGPDDGMGEPVLLSLSSTQIKKSKNLMTLLNKRRLPGPNGQLVRPPTFASIVRMTTIPEQNDEGTWYGVKFHLEGTVKSADLYQQAKEFHAGVSGGAIKGAYAEEAPAGAVPPGQF